MHETFVELTGPPRADAILEGEFRLEDVPPSQPNAIGGVRGQPSTVRTDGMVSENLSLLFIHESLVS